MMRLGYAQAVKPQESCGSPNVDSIHKLQIRAMIRLMHSKVDSNARNLWLIP